MLTMMNMAAKLSDLEDAKSWADLSDEADAERAIDAKTDTFFMLDGKTRQISVADYNFKNGYEDNYTWETLPRL